MLIYICQTPPCFQFQIKNKKFESGKGLFGRLWLFAGGLWLFAGGLWCFVIICDRLWSFVVAPCFTNYNYMKSKRGHSFERNKENSSFRTNDDTIIVQGFAFLYFPAVNIDFFLFYL